MFQTLRSIIMNGEKSVRSTIEKYPVKTEPMVVTDASYLSIGGDNLSSSSQHSSTVIVPNDTVLLQQYRNERIQQGRNELEKTTDENFNGLFSTISPTAQPPAQLACIICGDRATGKHYGAHSCDGCKGFFRRSIRKNHNYSCRFNRNCTVNKDKRNQCRYCRFTKCVNAGMKKEAVQNERDRINQRRQSFDDSNGISLNVLLSAENHSCQFSPATNDPIIHSMKVATKSDVVVSMKQQLIALVDWAQYITVFNNFVIEDRVLLLRARASEQLMLGVAWRSMAIDGVLLLGNCCIIPRDSADPQLNRIGIRVMDELVRLFQELKMDEQEHACLKAIVFFDPSIKGLRDVSKVRTIRYKVQLLLEDYINDRPMESRGRFGQLLLSLQVLQSLSWKMVELIHFTELFGERTNLDSFLAEMLLGECPNTDSPASGDDSVCSIRASPTLNEEGPIEHYTKETIDSSREIYSL